MNIQKNRNVENVQELKTLLTELRLSNSKKNSQYESLNHNVSTTIHCKNQDRINLLLEGQNILLKLEQLKVYGCELNKFPIEICQLKYLTLLNLSNNLLESLPDEIGNLCNLVTLLLSNNRLKFLPKTLRCIHQLNFLDISHNNFSEEPDVLHYGLRILQALDLSFNKISMFKDPPACINNLIVLDLSNNALEQLPTWIFSSLCQLQSLNVSNNPMYLNSEIVNFYGSRIFESLQLLNIENCNYSCKNIKILRNFKNLEVLHLGNKMEVDKGIRKNYFLNFSMKVIVNFKNVKCLYLQNVQIATLPLEFDSLKNISVLDLSDNSLSWLPDCFCNLSSLRIVYLTSNQLLFLPNNIGNLVNLQQIYLGNNILEEIPESFYDLINLEFVDFYNNEIKTIDEKIFEKKNLKGLDLELNCLNISHPSYDSLKTSLRKFFDVLHRRGDAQKTINQKTFDELSIESQAHGSVCSTASVESENYSDLEDQFEETGMPCSQKFPEDEDWEKNSFEVEEHDLFDPNENSIYQPSRNLWRSEFQKNYCPADYHMPSLMTSYRRHYRLALKEEIIEELYQ